jgi:chemotaxis methyl-accepting protein methylase
VWRRVDATRVCPAGPWDLVLCRNLLIYLQHHVIEAMLARIVDQIRPGGFVVLGDAERPMSPSRLTRLARCIYQTHGS